MPTVNPRPCFRGTPAEIGSGWLDREGVERQRHGEFTKGKSAGKPYSNYVPICGRCGGAGGADKWAHTGWTCYQCDGTGRGEVRPIRVYTADELATLNVRRDAQRAKKAEKARIAAEVKQAAEEASAAQRASVLASDPFYGAFKVLMSTFVSCGYGDDLDIGEEIDRTPDFLRDMWKRIQHSDLTEKQAAAVKKFIDSRDAVERRKAASAFIGKIGERIEVDSKVLWSKTIYYGVGYSDPSKYLIKFETTGGQVLTWFTQKYFTKGDVVRGRATVKAHNEYKGQKETQITNFRVSELIKVEDS